MSESSITLAATSAAPVIRPAVVSAPAPKPAASKPAVKSLDALKREYDTLAAQVTAKSKPGPFGGPIDGMSTDPDFIALRAKKKAAFEAYQAELHKAK